MSSSAGTFSSSSRRFFQAQDFAWLLFVAALIFSTPDTNYNATILLICIGAFQIAEPRFQLLSSPRGRVVSVVLKWLLGYLLVGYTHGILTTYYAIFLIPVVSAATSFELVGVLMTTLASSAAYLSFAIFPVWFWPLLTDIEIRAISLHVAFYAIVAFLVFQQASAKREEMARAEATAASLAESNRNLRNAEASLRRSERVAALGQLTAGLAHELRNPLGTIKASAEMLSRNLPQSAGQTSEVQREVAGFIVSEADRMNQLISHFLDFARPLQIHPRLANLGQVIDQVVRLNRDLAIRQDVAVDAPSADSLPSLSFDPDLLTIALTNLVQNAIQASEPGSTVELRANKLTENLEIIVGDHGSGIPAEHVENIFNPFFTTKPDGVGLGLAIVSKIIDEHLGRIRVESMPGEGTRFVVTLPVT